MASGVHSVISQQTLRYIRGQQDLRRLLYILHHHGELCGQNNVTWSQGRK